MANFPSNYEDFQDFSSSPPVSRYRKTYSSSKRKYLQFKLYRLSTSQHKPGYSDRATGINDKQQINEPKF